MCVFVLIKPRKMKTPEESKYTVYAEYVELYKKCTSYVIALSSKNWALNGSKTNVS